MADAIDFIAHYASNFYHNLTHMLDDMNYVRWLRLIAVVGGYFLIRPYVLKYGAKVQAAEHEKSIHPEKEKVKKPKISANSLRGAVEVPDSDESDEGEGGETTGNEPQWGRKARKRSRKVVREILEEKERLLEEDVNEDIKEFLESDVLVDYKEGEDGW